MTTSPSRMAAPKPVKVNTAKPPKEVQTYVESYRAKVLTLEDQLPTLRHIAPGFKVVEAYVQKCGTVRRGERVLEFQDIRVYLET
jgi:hypothetical protein